VLKFLPPRTTQNSLSLLHVYLQLFITKGLQILWQWGRKAYGRPHQSFAFVKSSTILLIFSKIQLDDDPIRSKHVAIKILYKVVSDGYLFTHYFSVQHNRLHNYKIIRNFSRFLMGKCWSVIAVFIVRLYRKSTDVWHKIFSEGKEKKPYCHLVHDDNFSSCS
jgi:hypothetical protein